jgi:hypothetical protein
MDFNDDQSLGVGQPDESKVTPTIPRKTRYKIKRQLETPNVTSKKMMQPVGDGSVALKEIINLNSYVTPQAEKQ